MRSMLRYLKLWQRYALVHRRRDARTLALLAHSDYFDPAYYLELYRDVAAAGFDPVIHYVDYGAAEMRNPSPYFNTAGYLRLRGDAFGSALNPLEHFLRYGRHDAALAAAAKETALKPKPLWEPTTSMYHGETSVSEKLPFRYVVYTAIVAGYDDLKLPLTRPPNCDFVVFSDAPLEAPGWKVLPINYLTRDPTRAARFVKLHPHLYFPEYSHSIWLDGNVGVRGDVGAFFERLTATAFLSAFVHPLRDCIYQEGRECIIRRKDHAEVITQYLERLRARNIPEHLGLWESNVIVRRHNDRECISLMRAWWKELESGSRRDQLGLPVVLRDFPGAATPLDRPGISARQHPLLTFSSHRTQRKTRPSEAVWRASTASRPEVPPISVVVCVHNSLEVVRDCLGSLAIAHRPGDVIILVDDASDHPTASFLDDYARTQVGVRLIRNSETLGYTRSANLGMKAQVSGYRGRG